MYHVGNAVFVETVSPTVWGGESDTLWGVIYGSLETGPPAGSVDEASQKLRAFTAQVGLLDFCPIQSLHAKLSNLCKFVRK